MELSATCSGSWTLNGQLIRSGADYLITRSKTTHTLVIREVTASLDGAQVKFVGGGSESLCTLSVKSKKYTWRLKNKPHIPLTGLYIKCVFFKKYIKTFQTTHIFILALVAPARFTKKYSEAEIFTFSAHSSAQLYTEVSDVSVQVTTNSDIVILL